MSTILYIEDEQILRDDIAELLLEEGHNILLANNGRAGIEMALIHEPDLILCDIFMPKMSGWEVLAELKSKCPANSMPPFLYLTALFDEQERTKGFEAGAVDYLVKPIDWDVLISKIQKYLNQSE